MSAAQLKLNPPDIKKIPSFLSLAIVHAFSVQLLTKASVTNLSMNHATVEKYSIDCLSTLAMRSSTLLGLVSIGFPKVTYLNVLEKMIGEKVDAITNENSDAASEILNIIYASARKSINEVGFDFEPSIPTTITGGNLGLAKSNLSGHTLFFECSTEIGDFLVFLSLKSKSANDL